MAQTSKGAMLALCHKAGCTWEEFESRVAAGEKWCWFCKIWHPRTAFGSDSSRYDGLAARCKAARSMRLAETYVSKATGAPMGPPPDPPRSGDKRQARKRVNVLVESGRLPRPNSLPCFDCGHRYADGERRHEYDHYLGYDAEHHYHVQAVCTTCHGRRTRRAK